MTTKICEAKRRQDHPDRLIPVIPNDILLGLIQFMNLAIEARVTPSGWEYVNIEFWHESSDKTIVLGWTPEAQEAQL